MTRAFRRVARRSTCLTAAAVAVLGGAVVVTSPAAQAASCSAVEVDFARGTGEAAGLGSVGKPFVTSLTSDLSGRTVTSYAVNYAANSSQSSAGPGSTDLVNHVSSVASSCPGTVFVLGGYSQGASATYGGKAKSYCNTGDPVCGGGSNFSAHLQYARNGSTTTGAQFAATKITG